MNSRSAEPCSGCSRTHQPRWRSRGAQSRSGRGGRRLVGGNVEGGVHKRSDSDDAAVGCRPGERSHGRSDVRVLTPRRGLKSGRLTHHYAWLRGGRRNLGWRSLGDRNLVDRCVYKNDRCCTRGAQRGNRYLDRARAPWCTGGKGGIPTTGARHSIGSYVKDTCVTGLEGERWGDVRVRSVLSGSGKGKNIPLL